MTKVGSVSKSGLVFVSIEHNYTSDLILVMAAIA